MLQSMGYPGGKNGAGVYQRIINLMPPHDVYVEPFLGGGAVMRLKRPAGLNVGLDLDAAAVDAFLRPNSPQTAISAPRFRIRVGDGIAYLERHRERFSAAALIYCDPPYLMSTRSGRRMYRHELTAIDHRRFLRAAIALPCRVMISGYWSEMYAEALREWNHVEYQAVTRGATIATEHLWFNFPEPVELHDYRYLGEDFRERERIKRKKARWTDRLARMSLLERRALLDAISAVRASGPISSQTSP